MSEGGRFKEPVAGPETQREKDVAAKYDEDLFQTGRLVTCGLYINVIRLGYLRTIVGLNRVNSTLYVSSLETQIFEFVNISWRTLDPRVATDHTDIPRGQGNACSAEFNLYVSPPRNMEAD